MNSVFVKYASLMKYEPERPDKQWKWNDKKFVHWIRPEVYLRTDWNDNEEEEGDFEDDDEEEEEKDEL